VSRRRDERPAASDQSGRTWPSVVGNGVGMGPTDVRHGLAWLDFGAGAAGGRRLAGSGGAVPNVKRQDAACGRCGKHRQEAPSPSIRERDPPPPPPPDGLGSDGGRRRRAGDLRLVVGGAALAVLAASGPEGKEIPMRYLQFQLPSPFLRLRWCLSRSTLL
jgi:hypothetical protein